MIHIPFLFTYSSMQPIIWQQLNAFTHTDMDKTQVHSEHQTGGKISTQQKLCCVGFTENGPKNRNYSVSSVLWMKMS